MTAPGRSWERAEPTRPKCPAHRGVVPGGHGRKTLVVVIPPPSERACDHKRSSLDRRAFHPMIPPVRRHDCRCEVDSRPTFAGTSMTDRTRLGNRRSPCSQRRFHVFDGRRIPPTPTSSPTARSSGSSGRAPGRSAVLSVAARHLPRHVGRARLPPERCPALDRHRRTGASISRGPLVPGRVEARVDRLISWAGPSPSIGSGRRRWCSTGTASSSTRTSRGVLHTRLNDGAPATTGSGVDYLQVCDRAALAGVVEAGEVATGLREILSGERQRMELEYPCPSADRRSLVPAAGVGGAHHRREGAPSCSTSTSRIARWWRPARRAGR
jgi:hypothetical protein